MRRVNRVPGITKVEECSLTVLQSRLKVPRTRPELRATEGSRRTVLKTHVPGVGIEDHCMHPGHKKSQTILMGQGTDRGQPDSDPLLLPKQFPEVWGRGPYHQSLKTSHPHPTGAASWTLSNWLLPLSRPL